MSLPTGTYLTQAGSEVCISGEHTEIVSVKFNYENEGGCVECQVEAYPEDGFLRWSCEECGGGTAELVRLNPNGGYHKGVLSLPLVLLGPPEQAFYTVQILSGKQHPTIMDAATLAEMQFHTQAWCGEPGLFGLKEALARVGLEIIQGIEKVDPRSRRVLNPKAQAKFGAQVKRFLEGAGPDLLRDGTLEEIGNKLRISRERARQIIDGNPILTVLRGSGPHAKRTLRDQELAKAVIQGLGAGDMPTKITRDLGVPDGKVMMLINHHPHLRQAFEEARKTKERTTTENHEALAHQVADYVVTNKTSIRAACNAVGCDYSWFIDTKNKLSFLKNDPDLKKVLYRPDIIKEQVEVVRYRIVNDGLSFAQAKEGVPVSAQTLSRHLSKDPAVAEIIASPYPRPSQAQITECVEIARERILKDGMSLTKASIDLPVCYESIRRRLVKDSEVAAILAAHRRGPVTKRKDVPWRNS